MVIKDINKEFAHYLIDNFESQIEAAKHFSVSDGFISGIKKGWKPPTKAMLKEMGIVKKVIFVRE